MSQADEIQIQHDGAVTRLTFNRPDEGNGFTDGMAAAMIETLHNLPADTHVVLLKGNGNDFCTGKARIPNAPAPAREALDRRDEYDPIFNTYTAIRQCPAPVVGVIQGRAMGFGTAVAALCDVSFAEPTARFCVPEMQHKILPTMVMSALYDRLNPNAIFWLTLSTEFITAEEALQYGLVSRVAAEGQALAQAEALCQTVAQYPAAIVKGLKEFVGTARDLPYAGALNYARSIHAMVNTSSKVKPHG